jgi:mannose-6-phosphate isomerase
MDDFYYNGNRLYPIKIEPVYKDNIWGGTKLLNKNSDFSRIAESWVLSAREGDCCKISNGKFSGRLLSEIFALDRERILGTNCNRFDDFPILIKFIDAAENLSIQVHPNEAYANKYFSSHGKTELWYVCEAEPGSKIILGFKRVITKKEFSEHILENTILEDVNEIPVKKGDVFYIKPGTLHSIGKGILIAEIQQNSDTTFRIYDYGRVDKNGIPRKLHVGDAMLVTECTPPSGEYKGMNIHQNDGSTLLTKNRYFTVYRLDVMGTFIVNVGAESFCSLLVTDGAGTLIYDENGSKREMIILRGESLFIPAGFGKFEIRGNCTILKTVI